MDANKTAGEKARRQLHKNAASNFEQILEATPHKAPTVRPTITKTIKVRRARHAGHCWRSRDKLISDVLLWTPSYGWTKAGRPARTYIQQLCGDTGCSPEDLPIGRSGERGSGISVLAARHHDNDEFPCCPVLFPLDFIPLKILLQSLAPTSFLAVLCYFLWILFLFKIRL